MEGWAHGWVQALIELVDRIVTNGLGGDRLGVSLTGLNQGINRGLNTWIELSGDRS